MDRFEDLRAFVQVVESGSITKAARTLQIATSAVSRRIRDLEMRLGTQLLQRTTRQMKLTSSGEQFHLRARDILAALEEAENEAGDATRTLSGPLRIAAPLSFGQTHLTPILIDFAKTYPDVILDVDLSDRFVDLIAEGHDIAIRIGRLQDSSLIARKLADVRLVAAASSAFWEKHGAPEKPEDLAGLPGLQYTGGVARSETVSVTGPGGMSVEIAPTSIMRSTNGELLRDAAVAGLGWTLSPSFILRDAIAEGQLVPVLTNLEWPTITIYVVYPQTRHLSARARTFIEFVRHRIGPKAAWEDFLD